METKHTKGEWEIYKQGNIFVIESNGVNNWKICQTITDYQQDEANGKLIAAAPEMLQMLIESLKVIEWYMDNSNPCYNKNSDFFNIGMNQREQIESLIIKVTK